MAEHKVTDAFLDFIEKFSDFGALPPEVVVQTKRMLFDAVGNTLGGIASDKGKIGVQLAEKLGITDRAVSKWETGRGYPDISLIEPLASALGVSVIELFSGENVANTNRAFNMTRIKIYVCPVCGNTIDRDFQASLNLKRFGEAMLKSAS